MEIKKVRLGKTGLMVTKTAFGALPVQRVSRDDAVRLLRRAFDAGINYFDTANAYTDSEEKLGEALRGIRHEAVISTKSGGGDKKTVQAHIEESLRRLQTDYIDLFQFHNPAQLPDPEDPDGPFAAALEAKKKGYIRHIGITNHRLPVALAAVESGNFETMQFPFCYLSSPQDIDLMERCRAADMGFIAMKGLSGGMLSNAAACFAFMQQYESVVPIWGVQHEWELDEFLTCVREGAELTAARKATIEKDRGELAGEFCRGCGYCMPCPVGIEINNCARMTLMLHRAPAKAWLTEEWQAKMKLIEKCLNCRKCASKCPFGLDTPRLLKENYDEDWKILAENK